MLENLRIVDHIHIDLLDPRPLRNDVKGSLIVAGKRIFKRNALRVDSGRQISNDGLVVVKRNKPGVSFAKFFDERGTNRSLWTKDDMEAYHKYIYESLKDYINKEDEQ